MKIKKLLVLEAILSFLIKKACRSFVLLASIVGRETEKNHSRNREKDWHLENFAGTFFCARALRVFKIFKNIKSSNFTSILYNRKHPSCFVAECTKFIVNSDLVFVKILLCT